MAAALSSSAAVATRPCVVVRRASQARPIRAVRVEAQKHGEGELAAQSPPGRLRALSSTGWKDSTHVMRALRVTASYRAGDSR